MGEYKKYWIAVVAVLIIGFSILGYLGTDVYHQAPPVPTAYVSQDGQVLFTKEDILHGQSAWQSTGGQSVGTVLGHGAYQAPDWTADWLHKEVSVMLDIKSQEAFGALYDQLGPVQQAAVKEVVKKEYLGSAVREDGTVVLSPERITAMNLTGRYFVELYGDNPDLTLTRDHFAMKDNTLPELQDRIDMARFFFWTTWMASTQRPGTDATYTNNWPHEPLLDHNPTPESIAWSVVSVIILLCGIGVVVWLWSFGKKDDEHALVPPAEDPISKINSISTFIRKIFIYNPSIILIPIGDGWYHCSLYCRRSSVLWYSFSSIFPIFYCPYMAYSSVLVLDCYGILKRWFILGTNY